MDVFDAEHRAIGLMLHVMIEKGNIAMAWSEDGGSL
jgi:hypothetical protein